MTFYVFPIVSLWELMNPGGAILTPGAWLTGFIKRITIHCYTKYEKEGLYTLLHTKYESSGPCGFGEEDFIIYLFFFIVSLWQIMIPGVGPVLTPVAWLAGFIKKTTIHCYIQNMKGLGLMVSEKKIFYVFL